MIEIPSITQHQFAIWHLLSLSEMNKVIERGCCAVTWVIERLIIIYVEKWADLIRLLKSEESTESKGSNLSHGGQPYGCSQAFRSDWNSAETFVTNLEMQSHVLDSTSVRQFSDKIYSNTSYTRFGAIHTGVPVVPCLNNKLTFLPPQQVSPGKRKAGRKNKGTKCPYG